MQFTPVAAFNGFSVSDLAVAKTFYAAVLGLSFEDKPGGMSLQLPGGTTVWVYEKSDYQAPNYTLLNFVVPNIDDAVDALSEKGIVFEHYDGAPQDEKGIMHGLIQGKGPDIAWFKDPAGNILSVLQDAS